MSFQRACALSDLTEEFPVAVEVDGVDVAFVLEGDEVFAIKNECSHAAVPLSEGEVDGGTIECFLHGSCFDLRTGKPTGPPAIEAVPVYAARIEGPDVLVDLTPTNQA